MFLLAGKPLYAFDYFSQAIAEAPYRWEPHLFWAVVALFHLENPGEALVGIEKSLIYMPMQISQEISGLAQFYRALTLLLLGKNIATVISFEIAFYQIPPQQAKPAIIVPLPQEKAAQLLTRISELPLGQKLRLQVEDLLLKMCIN